MKKLREKMDAVDFVRLIKEKDPRFIACLNCPHPNGECVDFAMQGKCKAYHGGKR